MVTIKSDHEVQLMREAGQILAKVHMELSKEVRPGMSTWELDQICEKLIRSHGCIPSFKGYEGFPASACISVNEEVVHGIPDKHRYLQEGDIVSVDTGVIWKGWQSDAARTHAIGEVSEEATLWKTLWVTASAGTCMRNRRSRTSHASARASAFRRT